MAKDEIGLPPDDATPIDPTATDAAADDTEGHSIGLLLGLGAMEQASRVDQRARDRRYADEDQRLAREAREARAPKKKG